MKKIILLTLTQFILLSASAAWGTSNVELYTQAQTAYNQQQYHKALDTYTQITPKGAGVWYNMGVCYIALEQPAQALLHWRRAQKNGTYSIWSQAETWCTEIKNKQHAPKSSHFLQPITQLIQQAYQKIVRTIGILPIQLLFLLAWILLLLSALGYGLPKRKSIVILLAMVTIALGSLLLILWIKDRERSAVIISPQVIVHAGPDSSYHAIDSCHTMDEVFIDQERNAWYKIHYKHTDGWIPKDYCEII